MKRGNVVAFMWGIVAAFFLQMLTADTVRRVTGYERCPYQFPWSGQCSRRNHHHGRHY